MESNLKEYTIRRLSYSEDFGMSTFTGGHNATLHRHPEFEIHYLTNCKGATRIVGDSVEDIKGTQLTFIGSRVTHRIDYYSAKDNPDQFEMIFFGIPHLISPALLSHPDMKPMLELKKRGMHGISFGTETIAKVEKIVERMRRIKCPSKLTILQTIVELLCIMAEAEDGRLLSSVPSASPKETIIDKRVRDALTFIDTNFMKPLKCEDVAKVMGLAVHSANRLFKHHIGDSIIDVLVHTRLENSARMLVETKKTISEVCFSCGFNNLSYFNRMFRRKYQTSPKTFRIEYGT